MTLPPLTALIVEDTADVVDFIRRAMVVLGHQCICVTNLQDARKALATETFHYALVDLKIPALPDGLFPDIQCGLTFVSEIGRRHGLGKMPVFVMTTYTSEGFDMAVKLTQMGASRCIPKPLDDTPLPQIISETLAEHATKHPLGGVAPPPRRLEPFKGGSLAYFPDRIELTGQVVAEDDGCGHMWGVLQTVRRRNPSSGKAACFSGAKLAKELGISGKSDPRIKTAEDRAGENAVAQCVGDLRDKCTKVMFEIGLDCKREDVIANGGKGYHLRDWITIEEHDRADAGTFAGTNVPVNVPANVPASFENIPASLNNRQQWVLRELRKSGKLGRSAIENRFNVGEKTAKRDLSELVKGGLIEYVRNPRPGHYRLARRG